MKKNYLTSLFVAAVAATGTLSAQCELTLNASRPVVCKGDTVTLSATSTPAINTSSLTTTMAAGNDHRGNMFDIVALNTVTITSFDAHPMGNTTIAIYYRTGTYAGFTGNSAGWTLIGSAAVIAEPAGTPTPVPVPVNITIPAGQTYAFYITSTNVSVSLKYTDGSSEGATFVSDANINFKQGVGLEYPFSNGGSVFTPRVWNGVIHYTTPVPSPVITYAWSTSESTSAITPTVNATTTYSVTVTSTGCPTLSQTTTVVASDPQVVAGADVSVCDGVPVTLTASGDLDYAWNNGITNGVAFTPVSTMDYIVTGTDSLGCTDTDTVMVAVNPLPVVSGGGDRAVCAETYMTLSGSGANTYVWDNGVTDGVPFPAADGLYVVTGTDLNGCTDNDTVAIMLNHVDVSTTSSGTEITAVQAGLMYSWVTCPDYTALGATGQTYNASANGDYAVIITNSVSGCVDTSACVSVTTTGLAETAAKTEVAVYPNPNSGSFTVKTTGEGSFMIVNEVGQIIKTIYLNAANNFTWNVDQLESGIYFISGADRNARFSRKIIVTK